MSNVRITLTPNPGLSKDEILKILASHDTITPEAIADVILANNERIALRVNTCVQSINP
jgi:hypothetical protein